MDGFKDSTKMKYMMGGDVKAYKTGGTVKKAMGGTCSPMKKAMGGVAKKAHGGMMDEGVSSRPTDSSGRRMTDAELGMGRAKEKKPMAKGSGVVPAMLAASKKATDMMMPVKKGVPSYSDRPMIRRSKGGLSAMPKGKC